METEDEVVTPFLMVYEGQLPPSRANKEADLVPLFMWKVNHSNSKTINPTHSAVTFMFCTVLL